MLVFIGVWNTLGKANIAAYEYAENEDYKQ